MALTERNGDTPEEISNAVDEVDREATDTTTYSNG
jgi:hypothetical protein